VILDYERLSRTVAHALRHDPAAYELTLDEHGWVAVSDLLAALRRRRREWRGLSESDLHRMLSSTGKRRYELRGDRIRALYGHSVPVIPDRHPIAPPEALFHGCDPESAGAIMTEGLRPMGRQFVHLSGERADARAVGSRRTAHPVILRVAARRAHEDGVRFWAGNDEVWLAETIPPQYILPDGE
jgi:putative RNA 2'-phosphotransferase